MVKEVESKYLDSENTLTAPFFVCLCLNKLPAEWMINSREMDTYECKKVILCSSQLANAKLILY